MRYSLAFPVARSCGLCSTTECRAGRLCSCPRGGHRPCPHQGCGRGSAAGRCPVLGSSAAQHRSSNSLVTWGKRLWSTHAQGCHLGSKPEQGCRWAVSCWALPPGALLGHGWRLSSGRASDLPLCWGWPEDLCSCRRLQPGFPVGCAWRPAEQLGRTVNPHLNRQAIGCACSAAPGHGGLCFPVQRGWRLCARAARVCDLAVRPSVVAGSAPVLRTPVATLPGGKGHRWEAGRLGSLPGRCCGRKTIHKV